MDPRPEPARRQVTIPLDGTIWDSMGHASKKDAVLIAALAAGVSVTKAAEKAGVSRRTVARRLLDESFRQSIQQVQREALSRATARLTANACRAARKLGQLIDAENDGTAIRASVENLKALVLLQTHNDHEERLTEIERRFTEREGHR